MHVYCAGSRIAFRRVFDQRNSGPMFVDGPGQADGAMPWCPRLSSVTISTRDEFTTQLSHADCVLPALLFVSSPKPGTPPVAAGAQPIVRKLLMSVFTQLMAHRRAPVQRCQSVEVNVRAHAGMRPSPSVSVHHVGDRAFAGCVSSC